MQEENKVKRSFFQNLKAELKKVIWPTGKQVVKNTFATIVFVLIISLALIIFNLVFEFLKTELWYEPIFGEKVEEVEEKETTSQETIDTATEGEVLLDVPEKTGVAEVVENAEATEVVENAEAIEVTE